MAIDRVSVCNQAIIDVGGGEFASPLLQAFEEQTDLGAICRECYPDALDMALESHAWNWANFYARLGKHPDEFERVKPTPWTHMYLLPTDPWCLKVRHTVRQRYREEDAFEVGADSTYGRVLYSDDDPVTIAYTGRVENLNVWSPLARQVLIKVLASKFAKPIAGQNSLTQLKLQEAAALLAAAQNSDGREGSPIVLAANYRLVRSRYGRTGAWQGDLWRS